MQRLAMPLQGDADREIRNGYPNSPYLPADPGRRERLLQALGYLPGNDNEGRGVITTEEEEAEHA